MSKRSLLRVMLALPVVAVAIAGRRAEAAGQSIEDFYKVNVKPDVYLAEVFAGAVPPPKVLESSGGVKVPGQIASLPGRLRYWRKDGRTAWIFDELGKEGYQPTTCGFIVKGGAIESARVLIYRESRGENIKEQSFLQQLVGTTVAAPKRVDNIAGATYSVKMMERMARMALQLDSLAV